MSLLNIAVFGQQCLESFMAIVPFPLSLTYAYCLFYQPLFVRRGSSQTPKRSPRPQSTLRCSRERHPRIWLEGRFWCLRRGKRLSHTYVAHVVRIIRMVALLSRCWLPLNSLSYSLFARSRTWICWRRKILTHENSSLLESRLSNLRRRLKRPRPSKNCMGR